MRIAFLGLGQMGRGIAGLLVKCGHEVTVWNRTPRDVDGATTAATAVDAVRQAEAVFSMVFGDEALDEILFAQSAIDEFAPGTIHVVLSTISVALARKLEQEHEARGLHYIASPVFGRPAVAAEGKLWLIVAGAEEPLGRVRPLLEQFSRGITLLGDTPAAAHALKLGGNFLISSMIAALSEGATCAQANGVEPDVYLEAVNNALFQSPFYVAYSKVMLHPPAAATATIQLGQKDTRLFREAAGSVPTPLGDLLQQNLDRATATGHGQEDWAAGYYAQAFREAGLEVVRK